MATANIKAVITAEDRASATIGRVGDNVDTTAVKMTNALKVAAAAAAALAVVGIGAAVKASWDQVDAVQQATVALKAYERDGAKVNKVLSDLVGYARSDMGVLFNRKDLFQSAQSLKLMGDNTGDLVDHVKILSRSVGLGLTNWSELNLIVGRVGSTGRLTGEDFDNLTKAGFRLDPQIRNTDQTFQSLFQHLDKGIPADALAGQADTIQGRMIRLQTAFRNVGDAILGVDSETGKFVDGGLGDKLTNGLLAVTDLLKKAKQPVSDLMGAFSEFGSSVSKAIEPVKPIIEDIFEAITIMAMGLITGFKLFSAELAKNKEFVTGFQVVILGLAMAAGVIIVALIAIPVAIGLVVAAIAWFVGAITEGFSQFIEDVHRGSNEFVKFVQDIINWFSQLGSSIVKGMAFFVITIGNGINNAVNWFVSLPGRILNAIGNVGNLLYNTGKSIVDGLVKGIQDVAGNIGKALGNASNDAVKKVKDVLGIHSPSTVFANIGQNMAEGMIQGIEGSSSRIANATSTMVGLPETKSMGSPSNQTTINVTFNGVFTSSEIEMRKLAEKVFNARQDAMNMNGQMA